MGGLVLYNTRTRRKERFEPGDPPLVKVYTCGPTVYGPQHIGNLRSQLFADILVRALRVEGFEVRQVINVTDVGHLTNDSDAGDDKMERAAAEAGQRADQLAERYTKQWQCDREAVGCLPPWKLCRATDHIAEQIELAQALEAGGYTYRIDDGLYFDTSKFPRYADFGLLDLAGQAGGARIGDVPGKHSPADFALWKFSPKGSRRQQEWDSPWGVGFPGWHLECSAMSVKYLGENFDIHTGGVDHIKVHHTNEIAQSECAYGVEPWVRYWLHGEFLDFRGEKMSKSIGNICVLDDLMEQGFPPLAFRYFFLQAHYRQQQTFTDEAMEAAATGYERLVTICAELRESPGQTDDARIAPLRQRFVEAMRDDLNAPRALAVAWEAARSEDLAPVDRWSLLAGFDDFLGLDLAGATPRKSVQESDPEIDDLVAARDRARAERDFAEADRLRDELAERGIVLEDSAGGTRWRRG